MNNVSQTFAAPASLTQDWSGYTQDMVIALAIVIAVVFLVSFALRHLQQRSTSKESHLQVIQALSVGAKDRVLLVQVGSDQVLMGVSAAGVTHLHTLSEPVVHKNSDPAKQQNTKTSFSQTIQATALNQ